MFTIRHLFNARNLIFASSGSLFRLDNDKVDPKIKTVMEMEINKRKLLANETGWERIKQMFEIDQFGNISPELNSVYQAGFLGFLIGAIYGGVISTRTVYVDFMENNTATAFKSHLDAKRKLQDKFTVNFAKGSFRWGWRISLFTVSYMGITTAIAVYRNKSSIWEYLIGGAVSGGLYKISLGLRGIAAGGIIGGFIGGVGGCASLLLMKITGTSIEDVRYWQYKWKLQRDEQVSEAVKNQQPKAPPLIQLRDQRLGTDINLDKVE